MSDLSPTSRVAEHPAENKPTEPASPDDRGLPAKYSNGKKYGVLALGVFVLGVIATIPPLLGVFSVLATLFATGVIAYFTMALFKATDKMRETGDAQRELMALQLAEMKSEGTRAQATLDNLTRAFIVANPPNIILKSLGFDEVPSHDAKPTGRFDFTLWNTGKSKAFIVECNTTEFVLPPDDVLPTDPPYGHGRSDALTAVCLAVGEHCPTFHTVEAESFLLNFHFLHAKPDGRTLVLLGRVLYEDELTNRHTLGFCYGSRDGLNWLPLGGDDYNFSH